MARIGARSEVRIGNVWDRTVAVLGDRGGTLGVVALLAFFLPSVIQLLLAPGTPGVGAAFLTLAVAVLVGVASLWGQLAIIALALDPATSRGAAFAAATARLPASLLVGLVLLLAIVLLFTPLWIALAASGFDFAAVAAAQRTGAMPTLPPSVATFVLLYFLALFLALLWLVARLFVVMAVVLAERRALGAIRRSVALTRGLALRIIGVALLYLIVFAVVGLAIQSIVGIVFRLFFAEGRTALLLTGIIGAAVAAFFAVLAAVFTAQLYAVARAPEAEPVPAA